MAVGKQGEVVQHARSIGRSRERLREPTNARIPDTTYGIPFIFNVPLDDDKYRDYLNLMTTTNTPAGLKVTYPYEATSPGVARVQCEECGGWERADKGDIRHGKRCESRPQIVAVAAPVAADSLNKFAADVRRTATTKGRDEEVFAAVRSKRLSANDAMNSDD